MKQLHAVVAVIVLALVAPAIAHAQIKPAAQSRNLEIYWIDADGGAATPCLPGSARFHPR